jgi:hypothetical protein
MTSYVKPKPESKTSPKPVSPSRPFIIDNGGRIPPRPKPPKSFIGKIGEAIGGAVQGVANGAGQLNPLVPIVLGINGGIAGYQGRPVPAVPANRANDPKRSVGSGSNMMRMK